MLHEVLREHSMSAVSYDISDDVWIFRDPNQPALSLRVKPRSVPLVSIPSEPKYGAIFARWSDVMKVANANPD